MTKINLQDFASPFTYMLTSPKHVKAEQFRKAKEYMDQGMVMHVAVNGVWSGRFPTEAREGSTVTRYLSSYEKIGYHSGSEWLLEGFLQAGGTCIFHGFRGIDGEVTL